MKKQILPGVILALLLGGTGVWTLCSSLDSFPKFNRYYRIQDYMTDVEQAMAENFPFSRELSELSMEIQRKGGARKFEDIFIGDDILIEDIGLPDEDKTLKNTQALQSFAENSRIPTYVMLLPTKCAIKQNEIPQAAPLFNQKQMIEQVYNSLLGKASVVDVYPALFSKYKQDLYYKTDPALTALGGYTIYEVLAQRLDNTPKPQEDFDIQYVAQDYYGRTYQRCRCQDVSPDRIALYRYQKSHRNFTVTHEQGYQYSYNTLYPQQMVDLGEIESVILGGNTGKLTVHSNLKNPNNLLIVGDGSILPVIPFLALHYSEITFLDTGLLSPEELYRVDCSQYQRILISYSVEEFIHGESPQKLSQLNMDSPSWQSGEKEISFPENLQ